MRSEGMGTQEGCRDGPVRDAPSSVDAAWSVLLVVGIFCRWYNKRHED